MHAQPYSEAPANLGRGRGRTSGGKRPVAVQIVRDLLHSRSGSGSGCFTDQSYFWIANRVYRVLSVSRRDGLLSSVYSPERLIHYFWRIYYDRSNSVRSAQT